MRRAARTICFRGCQHLHPFACVRVQKSLAVNGFATPFRRIAVSNIAVCIVLSTLLSVRVSVADELFIAQPPITCIVITSDGRTVIDGSQFGIRIRNFTDLIVEQTLTVPCRNIHDIVLSPDETKLAVVGGNPGESAWVGLYSWPTRDLIWSQSFSDDLTYAASFNASGKMLAVACHDHSVVLLDTIAGTTKSVLTGHSRPVTALAFVNDDITLLSCGVDQSIRVWDCTRITVVRSLNNHTQPITCLAVRPAQSNAMPMVATGSEDKTVRLWQPTIGRLVRFQRLPSPISSLTWTNDGVAMIAGCRDGRIRVIQADTLATVEHAVSGDAWITGVAVHPSQPTVVIGDSSGQLKKLPL